MKLKNCPWCKIQPEISSHHSTVYDAVYYRVTCPKCNVNKKSFFIDVYDRSQATEEEWAQAKADAIRRWNGWGEEVKGDA